MKKVNTIFMLLFLMIAFAAKGQIVDDTVRTIIFSEANGRTWTSNLQYVELANVGTEAVNLKNFELGNVWRTIHTGAIPGDYGPPMVTKWIPRLPDTLLLPGETFLIAKVNDYADNYDSNSSDITLSEILENVDLPIFRDEDYPGTQDGADSISNSLWENILGNSLSSMGYYLEYHVGGDSVLVDAIHNPNDLNDVTYNAVAGIPEAWGLTHILVRKTSVKQGNFNWDDARGTNMENSEWLPIPFLEPQGADVTQKYFTTIGHHGNSTLDDQSVASSSISIDWATSKMSVPWGIRKDSLMNEFDLGKGLAWNLNWSPDVVDSTHNIIVTGDTLTMYAVGETLQQIDFCLEQTAPAEDMNLVFPKNLQLINANEETYWTTPFYVTDGQPGMDSIGSVGFRTRVDTLFKYLEKAENASWEVDWMDGVESPDVKRGDILKVTAANGSVKDYYLAVDSIPEPSSNATLSAITWPDAPTFLRESPQWNDDTIPGFEGQTRFIYDVYVPYGTSTIPALKAISSNLNAKITEERATLITGTVEDRTSTFTVTAEDDSTVNVYTVTFIVEKPSELVQPFAPHPIISRLVYRAWGTENWVELSNPGNQPLDMSKYMLINGPVGMTPPDIVSRISDAFANRYDAYIPGYDYQSEVEWNVEPGLVEKDLTVNPLVEPGGSFVLGRKIRRLNEFWWDSDIIFTSITDIPEEIDKKVVITPTNNGPSVMFMHVKGTSYHLFEILNDSIRNGEKGINDIGDFKLLDVFGEYTGTNWTPAGENVNVGNPKWNFERKPEFWEGDTLPGYNGSWGETPETSEWICRSDIWYAENGFSDNNGALREGIGSHVFLPISVYNSTVTSYAYKVSDGYQTPQSIEGVIDNTTVSQLLANINKNDPDQVLQVMGKGNDDVIANEDTLMVTSADGNNVTKYTLLIGALDSDATLTSSV
ncbi:MAG: hypothetical protein KAS71_17865, partial [Bacteroidales bacterium]|nr:hypothetical protein [Bacteroidales bacterium]